MVVVQLTAFCSSFDDPSYPHPFSVGVDRDVN